jgi:hypothetical protein
MHTRTENRPDPRVIPFPRPFLADNDDDDRPPPRPAANRMPVVWRVVEARAA